METTIRDRNANYETYLPVLSRHPRTRNSQSRHAEPNLFAPKEPGEPKNSRLTSHHSETDPVNINQYRVLSWPPNLAGFVEHDRQQRNNTRFRY